MSLLFMVEIRYVVACGLNDKFNTFFLRQCRQVEMGEKMRKKINPSNKRRLIQERMLKIE